MNVVLCGMMGAGKTTVGLRLAAQSSRTCVDTDAVIEKKHGKISDIFAMHGEGYFRVLERETVKELSEKDNLVLSVGGGLVLQAENVAELKKKGKIVYLRAKKQTLVQRLKEDKDRPLLQGEDLETRIDGLIRQRANIYEHVADFVVDVDEKTPEQIAEEIVRWTKNDKG